MTFKVLVVDDDQENRMIIGEILEFNNVAYAVAEDGQQAVDMVIRDDYQLVLMDIMMPVLDGLQATAKIRAMAAPKSSTPIVAVTARRDLKAQAQWSQQGLDGFMSKPFSEDNLLALITKYR